MSLVQPRRLEHPLTCWLTLSSPPRPPAPPSLCNVREEGRLPLQILMLSQISLSWRRRRRRRCDSYDNEFSGRVLRPVKTVEYPSEQPGVARASRMLFKVESNSLCPAKCLSSRTFSQMPRPPPLCDFHDGAATRSRRSPAHPPGRSR